MQGFNHAECCSAGIIAMATEKFALRTGIHALTRTTVSTVTPVITVRSNVCQC
jgi:hypothetical protein